MNLPGGVTLPASPVNREIARKMWEAKDRESDASSTNAKNAQMPENVTVRELLDELKNANADALRIREERDRERMKNAESEQALKDELNAERLERMKVQFDNEKRRMQLEMMNRELECQRMLEEEREELRKKAERRDAAGRDTGSCRSDSSDDDDDDGFECLPMSDPASDIIIDLLNSIKLEKKLRLENREGNQSVSTISGFYDTTVHRATGIESFVKERMPGSSLKYAFQRFRIAFHSKKKPGRKTMMACMVRAAYNLCVDLRPRIVTAVKKAASLDHAARLAAITDVKGNGTLKPLSAEYRMMPLDKLPGMVQLNSDECASDMIESFETLIFDYICFESDAAHKLLGAEQDWRNLDGRNHTDCDTLLYDESQAFEVCLGWNSNAVADDYRRFRNLIQISPA